MARIRSVSPDLRTSETVAQWDRESRYAWVLLWGYLDDYGRGLDNARIIAADCFPLDDDVSPGVMGHWLDLYEAAGSICRYEHDGKRYLHALNWGNYQKPQHPSKVRVAPCPEHESDALKRFENERQQERSKVSGNTHEGFVSVSPTSREGEEEKESSRRGRPPVAAAPQPAKPPRCSRHSSPSLKSAPPCGECKELRIRFEATESLDRPALAVVPPVLACPEHPGELAHNCRCCRSERIATSKEVS